MPQCTVISVESAVRRFKKSQIQPLVDAQKVVVTAGIDFNLNKKSCYNKDILLDFYIKLI